jgi:hypothetical protein
MEQLSLPAPDLEAVPTAAKLADDRPAQMIALIVDEGGILAGAVIALAYDRDHHGPPPEGPKDIS